ncbi:chromatin DNA-binding EKC/KEOPS complex subunit GON7 Ecym_8124 [Eremothecium cymbalariae DBVPG|uniref:EKC/KEOPS complex subunit GON7 n=1 Tax=Eremothecium cymbalariae (strain CBS 270.75 / DBVPG 7215 / KCTC 17166 / NRRL Y-17582) TaxID=931890 RepID=G8JX41_ERECY|nr:Hypothetical protein Ecym_8124 [Eremothecium cymbalariae DBVPG\
MDIDQYQMSLPIATYSSPSGESHTFTVDANQKRYQMTHGETTGPSAYVLKAGQVDRDCPSDPKKDANTGTHTNLSRLRMQLTGLQDDINRYLTSEMELAKSKRSKSENCDSDTVKEQGQEQDINNNVG